MSAPNLTVAIQAGGKSSRMGTDKAFVLFQGRPMIEVVRERVEGLGSELIVVTNRPEAYAHLGLRLVPDVIPEQGPLGGIYTAIYHSANPYTLVVACDMPWLSRPLLEHQVALRGEADIVVPRWEKFPEPLHAVYSKACLGPIEENIREGRLKITGFYGRVGVRWVDRKEIERFDPEGKSFVNVNTPDELAEQQG